MVFIEQTPEKFTIVNEDNTTKYSRSIQRLKIKNRLRWGKVEYQIDQN